MDYCLYDTVYNKKKWGSKKSILRNKKERRGGRKEIYNIPVRPGRRLYYSYRTVLKYIKKRKEMYERNCTCKSLETREI